MIPQHSSSPTQETRRPCRTRLIVPRGSESTNPVPPLTHTILVPHVPDLSFPYSKAECVGSENLSALRTGGNPSFYTLIVPNLLSWPRLVSDDLKVTPYLPLLDYLSQRKGNSCPGVSTPLETTVRHPRSVEVTLLLLGWKWNPRELVLHDNNRYRSK